MTLHSLEEALADSVALRVLASRVGITMEQAREALSVLAELPAQQVVRMVGTARRDHLREVNRRTRLGR